MLTLNRGLGAFDTSALQKRQAELEQTRAERARLEAELESLKSGGALREVPGTEVAPPPPPPPPPPKKIPVFAILLAGGALYFVGRSLLKRKR